MTKIKYRLFLKTIILMIIVGCCQWANATHIVGGNLSYTCLGNDQYELSLVVRRDCVFGDEDAQFDDPASIGIYDNFGNLQSFLGANGQLILPFMGSDTIVDDLENGGCGFVGNGVCVHETTYRSIVQLPNNNFDYVLTYQRCCRNGSLVNVIDPLNTGATYSINLTTESMELCNNSPVFNQWADIYICNSQVLNFDHSATDLDGDSLVYKLCNPLDGASFDDPFPQPPYAPPYADVQWASGFSTQNMLGAGSSLSIDPNTGILSGIPASIGQFLIGICIEEYRDGNLLSITTRDFEYNVVLCAPSFSSLFSYDQNDCTIPTVTFEGLSMEADKFEWFFDYPATDPSLTSTDQNPSFAYGAPGTYVVRLEATRDLDGCTSSFTDTITVTDQALMSDFEIDVVSCDGDNINVDLTDLSNSLNPLPISNRVWIIEYGNVTETFQEEILSTVLPANQDITISLSVQADNGCSSLTIKEIEAGSLLPMADFDVSLLSCQSSGTYDISLNDRTDHQAFDVSSWTWSLIQNGVEITAAGPTVMSTVEGSELTIEMTVSYDNGCEISLLKEFNQGLDQLIGNIIIEKAPCAEVNGTTDPNLYNITAAIDSSIIDPSLLSFTWFVDGVNISTNPSLSSSSINYSLLGNDRITVELEYNGCDWSFERSINDDVLGSPDFSLSLDNCENDNVSVLIEHTGTPLIGGLSFTEGIRVFENGTLIVDSMDDPLVVNISNSGELIVEAYYVFGMSPNVCELVKSDTFDISSEILSEALIVLDKVSCDDSGIIYSVSLDQSYASASYNWMYTIDGNNFNDTNPSFELNLEDGQSLTLSLDLELTDNCKVSVLDTSLIVEAAHLDLSNNTFVPCLGDTVAILNNFNSEWTYVLTPSTGIVYIDEEPYVVTNQNGFYLISVTDGLCTDDQQFEVSLDDNPSVDIIVEKTDCSDDGSISVMISSTASTMNIVPQSYNYTYSIDGVVSNNDNPEFEIEINDGQVLLIDLIVIFENNCEAQADTYESAISLPGIEFNLDSRLLCAGDTIALVNNPNPDFEYQWSPVTGLIFQNGDLSNPLVVADQDIVYTVEISDGSCTISESTTVQVIDQNLEIQLSADSIICDNNVLIDIANPITGIDYEWSETNDFIDIIAGANLQLDFVAPNDFDTLYFYVRAISSGLECLDLVSQEFVVINGQKELDLVSEIQDCDSYTVCFEALNVDGEANWDFGDINNPNGMVLNDPMPCYTYAEAGNYTVVLSESNGICDPESITIVVEVPELLSISSALDTICFVNDTTILLTAMTTGIADSIQWCSNGQLIGTGDSLDYTIDREQIITAKIQNELGCTDSLEIVAKRFVGFANFEITAANDTVCAGDIFDLQLFTNMNMSELSYVWSPADCIIANGNTPNPTVSVTETKEFLVRVTDLTTNFDTLLSILITVSNPSVEIVSSNGDQLLLGASTDLEILNPDGASTYEWSTGDLGTIINIIPQDSSNLYTVTVTDPYGCTAEASYRVSVTSPKCTEEDVFLPTAFSPNGDSANDVFIVRSNFIKEMELTVYNRWGELLFKSVDQSIGWDGTYKGEILTPDAFAYCLKVTCVDDQEYVATGNVNLLR